MRLYGKLASWYPLLTAAEDYAEEADHFIRLVEAARNGPADTLLELGTGAGHLASHLKARFTCTLTDLSPDMLAISRAQNPDCEHLEGDMRTLDLGREFDVVLVHDAIAYMTTEADLAAAIATAAKHLRPGGLAVLIPDIVTDSFVPRTESGGHDGPDGRALRYLEWDHDSDPSDTEITVDFVLMLREPGRPVQVEHDAHTIGLFPIATWLRLMGEAGLDPVEVDVPDPYADQHTVFVGRRVAAAG